LAIRSQSRHSRPTVPTKIELAERLGYERACVFDSPALFADPWMTLARAADRTSSIRLGVSVITPGCATGVDEARPRRTGSA